MEAGVAGGQQPDRGFSQPLTVPPPDPGAAGGQSSVPERQDEGFKKALETSAAGTREKREVGWEHYIIGCIIVVIIVFCFFLIGLLNYFPPPQLRLENYASWIVGIPTWRKTGANEHLAAVTITNQTEKEMGKKFSRDWRHEHAILVDKLSEAGAKVIAFDMNFEESTEYDYEFANSIKRAYDSHNTVVVVGFNRLDDGQPKIVQSLKDAGVKSGFMCIGKEINFARVTPLVIMKDNGQGLHFLHSLSLEINAAFQQRKIEVNPNNVGNVDFFDDHGNKTRGFTFPEVSQNEFEQPPCPIISKYDKFASIIIDYALLKDAQEEQHSQSKYPYEKYPYELITKNIDNNQLSRFKDKIVLVGLERKEDLFPIFRGSTEEHYGFELHLAATYSLLNDEVIRFLSSCQQFLMTLCLGLLGCLLGLLLSHRVAIIIQAVIIIVLFLFYFAVECYLFYDRLIVLNPSYDIICFVCSYFVIVYLKKKSYKGSYK